MGSRRVGSLRARSFTGCRRFQDDVFVLELSSILLSSYFRLMSSGRPNLRNLLAQGYVPVLGSDGHTVYLVQSARAISGGVAFTFGKPVCSCRFSVLSLWLGRGWTPGSVPRVCCVCGSRGIKGSNGIA